ncbi:MAG: glycoside hydrolase family 3 C-terminal domain-containing protein, partial [Bacteroidales bacterium]|nr:glycoside hydrolase family 3 C-terminal domain-containing protein [Bacteroidales bacterium]
MIQTERELKVLKIREQMQRNQLEACIVSTPVNTYYLHQCIFQGYTYIPLEGEVFSFVRRPSDFNLKALQLQDGHCHFIRKPEQIIEVIQAAGLTLPESLGLEGEEMPVEVPGFRGGDRESIELPQVQRLALKALKEAGKRVVLVNFSGSAVGLVPESENCDAILQAWYPGQAGGTAIAD